MGAATLLGWAGITLLVGSEKLVAQSHDLGARIADVLRYTGVEHPSSGDVARMAGLWVRAQDPSLATGERQAAFRDLFAAYATLQGRNVGAYPQALDASARFAASIVAGGGRMDLALPEPRGTPAGDYLHVETRGHGPVSVLLIADVGVDGRKLYDSFTARHANAYTMHVVTLPHAGSARPLPWPERLDFPARVWLGQIERELVALVDRPHMAGVTVVGTAAGAYFAARLALLRPTRLRAAVLVNGLVKIPLRIPDSADAAAALQQRLLAVKSVPPAPQLWPVAAVPPPDELRRLIADPSSTHPSVQNWMAFAVRDTALSRPWTLDALAGGYFLPGNHYYWELASTDLTGPLRELVVPVLAMASRHDAGSPVKTFPAVSQWREVKLLYPDIPLTVVVVEQSRHYISVDAPQEFDRALAAFLDRYPMRGNGRRSAR